MPYEWRAGGSERPASSRRLRVIAIVAAAVLVLGTLGGIVASTVESGSRPAIERGPAATSVRRALLEAMAVVSSLGAPAPRGESGTQWAARGDALVAGASDPHLAVPEHSWLGAGGRPAPLDAAALSALSAGYRALLAANFTGSLLGEEESQLRAILSGEGRDPPRISSPGGASLVGLLDLHVRGTTATIEADVEVWSQLDSWQDRAGREVLGHSMSVGEVDAHATLRLAGGRWRLVALATPPYQEPT